MCRLPVTATRTSNRERKQGRKILLTFCLEFALGVERLNSRSKAIGEQCKDERAVRIAARKHNACLHMHASCVNDHTNLTFLSLVVLLTMNINVDWSCRDKAETKT